MENKTIGVIIAVMVGVIMAGSILIPVLNDAASDTKYFDNRKGSYFEMIEVDSSTEYVLIWDAATPEIVNINGTDKDLSGIDVSDSTIICSLGTLMVRYGVGSNGEYIQYMATSSAPAPIAVNTYPDAIVTISISGGTLTLSAENVTDFNTITASISGGYCIVPDGLGTHVMKASSQNAYILDSTEIVSVGFTAKGIAASAFYIHGTMDDLTITQFRGSVSYTIGEPVIFSNEINGYDGLNTISKFEFDVTNPDTGSVTTLVYSYFIVPVGFTVDKTNGAPLSEYSGMVFAIPIIVLSALLIVAVGALRKY